MPPYTEVHRVLLTLIRASKCISSSVLEKHFLTILKELSPEILESNHTVNSVLNDHISNINVRINQHGFKIDKKNHQVSGELHYIFINTDNDSIVKLNTQFSPKELECIKVLIDKVVTSEDYSLKMVVAGQVINGVLGKSLEESYSFINRLIDEGWLVLSKQDHVLLSMRSISELKSYLIDRHGVTTATNMGRILLCKQCQEIVTLGYQTGEDDAFHYKCYDVYSNGDPGVNLARVGVLPDTL
ncbi:uncharacterized protein CANTADRAFT_91036 [Suhomyces tanzawaensis NRRL Y-17324]|uniref:Non-structural maintenance of chromosomes element 1 homolog n=1 Tax=Suhomyces tanzawaensis NRRL Y-17324 TaxID=984487 RepID=A0A1E4SGV6_9ASCO|nr:uncharacterized protein CANTADRAFT_91036 [Suhomyces tanzawaensis NRRL Y-17324]ODV78743.1 hypothetical protein CANTADRAFT_91036 [Suhomyces tanzawaensis NRRL Y-17324]